ncbi:MAG: hypothetical protein ACRD2H_03165 [Terriglobales bacterium]
MRPISAVRLLGIALALAFLAPQGNAAMIVSSGAAHGAAVARRAAPAPATRVPSVKPRQSASSAQPLVAKPRHRRWPRVSLFKTIAIAAAAAVITGIIVKAKSHIGCYNCVG